MRKWTRRQLLQVGGAATLAACQQPESVTETGIDDTGSATRREQPHIIMIFPDQLRSQALSIYGEENLETPVFDTLLQEGVRFDNSFTPSPVCTPARSALLTGLYPHRTKTMVNGQRLARAWPTLTDWLHEGGYNCAWIGKWHLDGPHMGEDGFVPVEGRHQCARWIANNFRHKYLRSIYFRDGSTTPQRPVPEDRWEPAFQVDEAIGLLEEYGHIDDPMFVMLSFGPPHPPDHAPCDWTTDVPSEFLAQFPPESIQLRPNIRLQGTDSAPAVPESQLREHLQGYYGCIWGLEPEVARLLDAIDRLGLREDTLVVFASDHGEMAGSHGRYGKGFAYEEELRIPLGFRWPGTIPEDVALQTPVTLVDVAPTILGLAGIEAPPWLDGSDLSAEILAGEELSGRESVCVMREANDWRAIIKGQYRYMRHMGWDLTLLFDLSNDPYQVSNLAEDEAYEEVRTALEAELMEWQVSVDDPSLDS